MKRIRVLVVDDSVVVRRVITQALSSDPAIEVIGTASNGKLALPKVALLRPDAITLDIEMPEMDGLETLRHIRRTNPKVPIIMFSTLSKPGAAATLDALSHGASDFCTKPENLGGLADGVNMVKSQIVPKLKALCGHTGLRGAGQLGGTLRPTLAPPSLKAAPVQRPVGPPARVEAVVVAVSTGGPTALRALWDHLPSSLSVPLLVVQHMPPMFTTLLAQRLNDVGNLPMTEAVAGTMVQPGRAYLAPGDHHMTVRRDAAGIKLHLDQNAPENSCRPAADPLFRSAVNVWGKGVLAVVLTGMGSDGMHGCEAVVGAGGQVLAQDEMSSVVWGMPGQVVQAGLADQILPLNEMANAIVSRVNGRAVVSTPTRSDRAEVRL